MKRLWIFLSFLSLLLIPLSAESERGREHLVRIREERRRMQEAVQEAIRSAKQPILLQVEGQEDFDVTYYRLDLDVDVDNETLDGSVTLRATSLISDLTEIVLNFYDDMPVTSVTGDASGFTHTDNLVTVSLQTSYSAGQSFEVVLNYNGHPWEGNLGLSFVTVSNNPLVYTECSPFFARAWWPCKDTPVDKANSMDLHITLPDNLVLASIGALQSVVDNGDGTQTWHWHEGHPIATYLVSITAYPYRTFSDIYEGAGGQAMDVDYYVYPEDYALALEDFNEIVDMIEFFASKYTEYPFIDEKYGMAEYTGYYAAMEHQTCTSYGSSYITGDHSWDSIIAHELSHHWWGNSVSVGSWHDVWLKEGFASYSEALWMENIDGSYGLQDYMVTTQLAVDLQESVYRYDITDAGNIFVSEVYDKGAWVLHMLRHVVGDENFFQILQSVYETYAFGNFVTEELKDACEQISGQDLDWFFEEWVYDVWHPEYYWGWNSNDLGDSFEITGFIDQIQSRGPVFTMPVEMAIATAAGDTIIVETLWVDEGSERFQLVVNDEPTDVLLDPYNWILKEQSIITDPLVSYVINRVDDGNGNGDGRPDPGETVAVIVTLENIGTDVFGLEASLGTTDPDIEITSAVSSYGDVSHGTMVGNEDTPFTIEVHPAAETHVVMFKLNFTGQNGYTGLDSFYLTIGTPRVLLVDDDGGDENERPYLNPLSIKAIPFQMWDVAAEGPPGDTLMFFDVIVWLTGAERDNTLRAADQASLAAYLDAGGSLFLSGQDIGHDLFERGNGIDFFSNYLHATFEADETSEYFLQGITGDPISGQFGLLQLDAAQESPDVIAPGEGANNTLNYSPSGNAAGIKYGGDYRVVYFSIGFEGIRTLTGASEPMRADMLDNIISWLQIVPEKGDVNEDGSINILDVLATVNIVLGLLSPTPTQQWAADFNEDGAVDIIDAITIVNYILGLR
ncbi:MAG: hypothetical protein JSV84_12180 [Gemmatimonadota bacterium]|nr:MAG: hypothetical protein JSV84_12180 [Gemmatimonadota bacterium]